MRRSHLSVPMRLPAIALCLLMTSACVTRVPPITRFGSEFQPLDDEVDLWKTAREDERRLLEEFPTIHDPELSGSLERLASSLAPASLEAAESLDLRVGILDAQTPRVFTFPHGPIYLTTGLLEELGAEDDEETALAEVLAHELTHIELRHALRHDRAVWLRQFAVEATASVVSLALLVDEHEAFEEEDYLESDAIGLASDTVDELGEELSSCVTARRFARKLELEAEKGAEAKLLAAGYHKGPASPRS